MLFHFAWTIEQLERHDRAMLRDLVAELVRANRRGHHLISISRISTKWLGENIDLSDYNKIQIEKIGRLYTQTGALHRQAPIYIEILPIAKDYDIISETCVQLSPSFVVSGNILDPSQLVVENIDNDGWIFCQILNSIRRFIGLPAVNINVVHGGGVDILRSIAHSIRERRVACALMDSDKKFPGSGKSHTIKEAERVVRTGAWPLCFIKALPCHEIENIVPLDVVMLTNCALRHPGIQALESIARAETTTGCAESDRFWLYFDIKLGINEDSIGKMKVDSAAWHAEKFASIGIPVGGREITGFGDRLIPQIRASNAITSNFIKIIRDQRWLDVFLDIFSGSAWIFAADRKSIT